MGLTGAEVREIHALRLEFQRCGCDRHGCGNFDAADAVREYLRRCRCGHVSSVADLATEIKEQVFSGPQSRFGTFALRRSTTSGGTSAVTSPPSWNTPLISLELT